jgi:prolyl-tRNA editing enzyme YbaK/EbsC (Cys-tRNA(Pro) deacylase)
MTSPETPLNSNLSSSAQRVQRALEAQGVACEVVELPDSTRTASEAAAAIGCTVDQIAKSLIFKARESERPVLVIASGSNRVNEKAIGQLLGEPIGKANADFVREKTGFVIGGVPPLAHETEPETFIDEALLAFDEIWAAAGTPFAVFRLTPDDLLKITNGQVVQL